MKTDFFYNLGMKAAALASGGKALRPRFGGKFMRKAKGSSRRAPHHSVGAPVTTPTGVKI